MNALANSANATGPYVRRQTPSGGMNIKLAGLFAAILSLLSAVRAQEPSASCSRDVDREETRFHYYIYCDAHHMLLSVDISAIPNAQEAQAPANGVIPQPTRSIQPSTRSMELMPGNPAQVEALLVKFVEWDKIARENDVEAFHKPISKIGEGPQAKELFFYWTGPKEKRARVVFQGGNGTGAFDIEDAPVFLKLLHEDLPPLYKTLTEKLAKREHEAELFK